MKTNYRFLRSSLVRSELNSSKYVGEHLLTLNYFTGIVVFAGDVTPVEIMCHLPAVCEEKNIPYIFTPSRKDLGASMGVKRGCLMVLIRPNPEYQENFDELLQEIKKIPVVI